MPKYESRAYVLPPARLSVADFKAIERALGFTFSIKWSFWSDHVNITNNSLDDLLDEINDVVGLSDFEIGAESPDASIMIIAGKDGCVLEYNTPYALRAKTAAKAKAIEGVFRDRKRLIAYLPNFLSALRRPVIELGRPKRAINIFCGQMLVHWLLLIPLTFGLSFLIGWLVGFFVS